MFYTDILFAIAVAAIAVGVFWNSRASEFVFDDIVILQPLRLVFARRLRDSWRDFFRPPFRARDLLWATYRSDVLAHGVSSREHREDECVRGWRDRNFALHALNAVLVYALLRNHFAATDAALGAAVFAVHPIGTASVASISGRSSLLCGVFYLGFLLAVAMHLWAALPVIAFFGLRTKEDFLVVGPASLAYWWFA